MVDSDDHRKIPIIGSFLESKPSPIIIGVIVVLAIVILISGPLYTLTPSGNGTSGTSYITFEQLFADYNSATYTFRSYSPGDIVHVKDTVTSSTYSTQTNYTTLQFTTTSGTISIRVLGNVETLYPSGTVVIMLIQIISVSVYETINSTISQSDIWKA